MKAWLYYRLSRDEDQKMNSLQKSKPQETPTALIFLFIYRFCFNYFGINIYYLRLCNIAFAIHNNYHFKLIMPYCKNEP